MESNMKTYLRMIAAATLLLAPGVAFAQTDAHHPADAPAPAQLQAAMSPEMMQSMMLMMQNCMGMMQMMQGGTMPMQGGDMPMQGGDMPMQGAMRGNMGMRGGMTDATAAYMAAMSKMDMPMMQGIQASDPDVAFVKGMIPHHQGAIEMARVALQYADDEQVKAWANDIIAAQEEEIAAMQEWLKAHGE
jgi:uncharacterized protein (DUF305 family)